MPRFSPEKTNTGPSNMVRAVSSNPSNRMAVDDIPSRMKLLMTISLNLCLSSPSTYKLELPFITEMIIQLTLKMSKRVRNLSVKRGVKIFALKAWVFRMVVHMADRLSSMSSSNMYPNIMFCFLTRMLAYFRNGNDGKMLKTIEYLRWYSFILYTKCKI